VREFVRARGLDFAVFRSPEVRGATPLVCVNGGLLFSHALLWPALSPLARRRQLIFYDQRGRGATKAPPGALAARIEHDAGDIPALREALGLSHWDVFGHSWGGGIAMLATERDRDAVRRLVLVDAVGPTSVWMETLAPRALERLDASERATLLRYDEATLAAPDPDVQSAYARAMYPAWFADRALGEMFSPPRSTSVTGAAVVARLRREGYDWRPLLRALSVPTLVLHGEADLLPVKVAHELVETLPQARLSVIPDAGHMPFWEAPEHFFALVDDFLTEPLPLPPSLPAAPPARRS
jgi:proline iminopeptidase